MTLTEMQCVYFFKQFQKDGSYLIKIGMSKHRSPEKRLSHLKTYSPYGCELVGFISTQNASKLEKNLHNRFNQSRLNGEWFALSENKCHALIKHYNKPNQHIIKKMFAEFLSKEWSKKRPKNELIDNIIQDKKLKTKDKILQVLEINKDYNKTELAKELNISRRMLYKHLEKK